MQRAELFLFHFFQGIGALLGSVLYFSGAPKNGLTPVILTLVEHTEGFADVPHETCNSELIGRSQPASKKKDHVLFT